MELPANTDLDKQGVVAPSDVSDAPVRFGTSSWAYQGWQGLIYHRRYAKSRFSRDCLSEYAAFPHQGKPLFDTVGIDHTFYRPATSSQLASYAAQVPPTFRFCLKVWEELTIPIFARLPRYGTKAGTRNPRFLDAETFRDMVHQPAQRGLGTNLGVFLFEFQRTGLTADEFLDRLEPFLAHLPQGSRYAIEVRNPAILGPRYRDLLAAHGIAHVYNHWSLMPDLAAQHRSLGCRFSAPFTVARLLTPLGLAYAEAVDRFAPYNRLVLPQPRMRQDTVTLIRQAQSERRSVYVLVNNRAEGNAPMTIQQLVALLKS
ncbi:MAG: DUF72 domain-containing protein [Nitrospiraceae bacterium]